jgi:hypothetical protein
VVYLASFLAYFQFRERIHLILTLIFSTKSLVNCLRALAKDFLGPLLVEWAGTMGSLRAKKRRIEMQLLQLERPNFSVEKLPVRLPD